MCVSKDACRVCMCWRMISSPCIWGQIKMSVSCVKGTSVQVWNTILLFFHSHLSDSFSLWFFCSHSIALRLSALWKWKMELVINFPTCATSEKEWQFCLNDFDCLLSPHPAPPSWFLPRIFLPQKADVGVEEVSRCVQSRRTVWAHTPNPQSPRVYLQVYCSFTHALLAVSTFFSVLFLDPRQCK